MAELAVPLMIGGTAFSVLGNVQAGNAAAAAGKSQQQAYQAQAKQEVALGQRDALEERRKAGLLVSRAIAVSAAGGGGASDPSVVRTIADIEGEGAYRASTALYKGQSDADQLTHAGSLARWEGRQQRKAHFMKAATSALSGGASMAMYQRQQPDTTLTLLEKAIGKKRSGYR